MDEQDHENFADYRKAAETAFGFPVKSMTRKPFQVIFNVNGVEVFFRATKTRIACGTVVYK